MILFQIITLTGLGASYDPDYEGPETRNDGDGILGAKLYYEWSALFLANTSTGDYTEGTTSEQLHIIFSPRQGK